VSGSLRAEYRKRCTDHVHGPEEVGIEDLSPLVGADLFDAGEDAVGGAVHYHVDCAELGHGLVDRRADHRLVANVGGGGQDLVGVPVDELVESRDVPRDRCDVVTTLERGCGSARPIPELAPVMYQVFVSCRGESLNVMVMAVSRLVITRKLLVKRGWS